MARLGVKFLGSSGIETSTANQEIVPVAPQNWTMGYRFYKFSFNNQDDCQVIINNGDPIWLNAGQGFNSSEIDPLITSFIIVTSGIKYNWIGAY